MRIKSALSPIILAMSINCDVIAQEAKQSTLESVIFTDVIKSSGVGNIDLFDIKSNTNLIMSGEVLEAFRQNGLNKINFAVDVNEASNGLESADSQGIAVKSATLILQTPNGELRYDTFKTRTQTILKELGSETSQLFYTLLGEAGANTISSNLDVASLVSDVDALLTFEILDDLSQVTAGHLEVTLLTVDMDTNGLEQFYDFNNGFEQVAILTKVDADYLNNERRGADLAPLVIEEEAELVEWQFYPSSDGYYLASFEDLFPQRGDYDFNDLVVAYQVRASINEFGDVTELSGNGYLVARGAEFDHDFYLAINLPPQASGQQQVTFNFDSYATDNVTEFSDFNGPVTLSLVTNVKDKFYDGESTYVNTYSEQNVIKGPRFDFVLTFDTPLSVDLSQLAPFDPFIYVHDTGYEIHTVDHSPLLAFSKNDNNQTFRDDIGFPFALILNNDWQPPLAGVDMGEAYPSFVDHVTTEGQSAKTWYLDRQDDKVKIIEHRSWRW